MLNEIALGFPIQFRVKPWASIADKLERLDLSLDSIKELQDLVGLRLVLLFRRDVVRACELIREKFAVVRAYNTQERLKADQFGYSSMHLILELPSTWLQVPTLTQMAGLRAELQVRTLSQHTWAEASHKLQYKRKEGVPISIGRAINRVSALLETVDLEFERVLVERDSYRRDLDVSGTEDILNVDLIEKTLDSLLPPLNKADDEDYADLLIDLNAFNVNTQQKLRDLVQKHFEAIMVNDSQVVAKQLKDSLKANSEPSERISRGVFFSHTGLVRTALGQEFPSFDDYQEDRYFEEQQNVYDASFLEEDS